MAADYWISTQKNCWRYTKSELSTCQDDLDNEDQNLLHQWPLPEPRLLNIYLHQQILKLGKRLNVQQPVLATAVIFVRRFYLKVAIRKTNPYLLLATAFYLACKVEESPQHIKMVLTEARNLWPDFISPVPSTIGECEFLLISEIGAQLIVFHPYRSLRELHEVLGLTSDEYTLSWSFINDHYVTDLPFLYSPHVIAAAAITFTLVIRPSQGGNSSGSTAGKATTAGSGASSGSTQSQSKLQKLKDWLVASDIDTVAMVDCTQEMISLYVVWESYSDRDCREQISRFIKGRNLDR